MNFLKKIIQDTKNFFIRNPLVFLLFILSTLFFLIQHYYDFSWDFAAYLINAKYFFYEGNYIEVYRAPLISLILGPLMIFGALADYLYIFLISTLFLYASIHLAKSLNQKYFSKYKVSEKTTNFLFYFFMLNLFTLSFGLREGTELLALSFFCLFISNLILGKTSGYFLGLAFLSRYNFLIFAPFLFFNKKPKTILKNLITFFIVTFPWFLYNKIKWGNLFTSVADSFYLNIFSRLDRVEPFKILSLLQPVNWFLPFFILGLLVPIIILIRSKETKISNYKFEILFLLILSIFIYDIYSIPFKVVRYMFNFALPIAFFSTIGAILILKNLNKKSGNLFKGILLIGFIISLVNLGNYYFIYNEVDTMYPNAAFGIKDLGLSNCQVISNHWVPVNYFAGNVRFQEHGINQSLNDGEIVLIFPGFPTMDDEFNQSEIWDYPAIRQNEQYFLLANENTTRENCIPSTGYDTPMIKNSCETLSKKFNSQFLQSSFNAFCNFIN